MTYATNTDAIGIFFGHRFGEFSASIKKRMERARAYRTTVTELQSLSDRDLDDLGIKRDAIDGIAVEAAKNK